MVGQSACSLVRARLLVLVMAGVCLASCSGGGEFAAPDVAALRDRVASGDLDRRGIFVTGTSVDGQGDETCLRIRLLNPTQPNRDWLRSRYGKHVCVEDAPGAYVSTDDRCPVVEGRTVEVPDLRGMTAYGAARRLGRLGLTIGCHGRFAEGDPPYAPDRTLVVEAMCEREAPAGGSVSLRLRGYLPGGFVYRGGDCVPERHRRRRSR